MRTPSSTLPPGESNGNTPSVAIKEQRDLIPRDSVESFRALMASRNINPLPPEVEQREPSTAEERSSQRPESDKPLTGAWQPASDTSLAQAQLPLTISSPAQAASSSTPSSAAQVAAIVDLIEKHVRQLLISEGGLQQRRDAKVVLRLSASTLAESELLLARTDSGWRLHANARSVEAFHAIQDCTAELEQRFEDCALGTIEIESELHSEDPQRSGNPS